MDIFGTTQFSPVKAFSHSVPTCSPQPLDVGCLNGRTLAHCGPFCAARCAFHRPEKCPDQFLHPFRFRWRPLGRMDRDPTPIPENRASAAIPLRVLAEKYSLSCKRIVSFCMSKRMFLLHRSDSDRLSRVFTIRTRI